MNSADLAPPTGSPMPASSRPRVAPDTWHALGGMWRLAARRFFTPSYWFILLALLAVLVVLSIPAASSPRTAAADFLAWAAGFYVCFLVPILSFTLAAGAMRDDLAPASVDYVLTRPVPRSHYVVWRYLTQVGVAQIDFVFALLVVIGLGLFWQVPGLGAALPWLLAGQVAGVLAFSALGLLCGLLTSRYVIVGLLYGVVVEVGLGNVPTQLSQISLTRHLVALVQPLLRTGDGGWTVAPGVVNAAVSVPTSLGILALAILGALALASLLFARREFAGSAREL